MRKIPFRLILDKPCRPGDKYNGAGSNDYALGMGAKITY